MTNDFGTVGLREDEMANVPLSFVSSDDVNKQYEALRPQFLPLLESKARIVAFSGGFDAEDLVQEMEMRVLYGLATFDPSRRVKPIGRTRSKCCSLSPQLLARISVLATQVVARFLDQASCMKRSCVYESHLDESLWEERHYDDFVGAQLARSAEDFYLSREHDERSTSVRASFRARVDRRLDGFASDLFWCRVNPSLELIVFARNRKGRLPESPEELSLDLVADFHGIEAESARESWRRVCEVVVDVTSTFNIEDQEYLRG